MGFWDIFNWNKSQTEIVNPTKQTRVAPATVDWTDSLQVNATLTKGLYHNTYPGLKLGGALAYNPISVPVSFMGLPIPRVQDNNAVQEQLNLIVKNMADRMKDIHIQDHREGTIWIYPKLIWEFIPDASVSDVIRDLTTGEVIRIQTNEDIKVSTGDGQETTINRQRIFTKNKISVVYTGNLPAGLKNSQTKNPAGILPIPFSNNADGDEVRGHSDYERIVTDIKSYHDLDLAEQTALAKFSPKMIQDVKDVDAWAENNGYGTAANMFATIEIGKLDLILNMPGEKTTFEFPERMTESMRNKLKQIFHKIIEASGIPEIAWGLKTEGNLASVEENMSILMNYVKDKQDQKVEAYTTLFTASLRLLNAAFIVGEVPEISVSWNRLDGLSDATKAEIFKNFAEGISKCVGVAGMTKPQLHKLWLENYPGATEEDYETFEAGLAGMVAHTVSVKSTLDEILDSNGR